MGKFRKSLFVLIAILLVVGMSTTAFAATITVTNPQDDHLPYKAYKIFDAQKLDGDEEAYRYTISESSPWYSVLAQTDEEGNITSAIEGLTIRPAETATSTVHVVTFDGDSEAYAESLVTLLKANVAGKTEDASLTKAEGDTVAKATVTQPGYYFVNTEVGALGNLFTATDDISIVDKNQFDFDKSIDNDKSETFTFEVDQHDFQIGDTVPFVIEGNVPSTLNHVAYTYIVKDTMPEQLKLDKDSIKFYLNDVETTDNVTITATDTGFTAKVNMLAINGDDDAHAMEPIRFEYNAVVKEDAAFGIYKNKAELTHGPYAEDDPKLDTEEDEDFVFNHQIKINKIDGDSEDKTPLPGAEFVLAKEEDGKVYLYKLTAADDDNDAKIQWIEVTGVTTAHDAVGSDTVKTMANDGTATKVTTDTNGAGNFSGLEKGTYQLIEVKAPEHYNELLEPVTVVLQADGGETDVYQVTSDVENIGGSKLPETGGIGTIIFYVVGGIIAVVAIGALVAKKRVAAK